MRNLLPWVLFVVILNRVVEYKTTLWQWGWRGAPIGIVVANGLIRAFLGKKVVGVEAWLRLLGGYGLMVVGWVLGWNLPRLLTRPEVVKRLPGELGKVMDQSIRNVLTVFVLLALAVWVISSTNSALAVGMVFGLTTKLFVEALTTKDFKKWYWVFVREFTYSEHRLVMVVWAGFLLAQLVMLVRG